MSFRLGVEGARGRIKAVTRGVKTAHTEARYHRHVEAMIYHGIDKAVIPANVPEAVGVKVGRLGHVKREAGRAMNAFNTRRRSTQRERDVVVRNTALGITTAVVPPVLGALANVGAAQLGIPEVFGDTLAQGVRLGGALREGHNIREEQAYNPDGRVGVHKAHERMFVESGLLRLALQIRHGEKTDPQAQLRLSDVLPESMLPTAREQLDTIYDVLRTSIAARSGKVPEDIPLGSRSMPIVSTHEIKREDLNAANALIRQFFRGENTQEKGRLVWDTMLASIRGSNLADSPQVREMMMQGAVTGARNYLQVEGSKIQDRIRWQRRAKWINRMQTLLSLGGAFFLPAGLRDSVEANNLVHTALAQAPNFAQNEWGLAAAAILPWVYRAWYGFSVAAIFRAGHQRTKYFAERQKSLKKQLKDMRNRTGRILTHLATKSLFEETAAAIEPVSRDRKRARRVGGF